MDGCRDNNINVVSVRIPHIHSKIHAHHFNSYNSSPSVTTTRENKMQNKPNGGKRIITILYLIVLLLFLNLSHLSFTYNKMSLPM